MKWLLRAYPADYRRERGWEIAQTFLDAGCSRPTVREAINLVCHGMRARLGRPASRSVVLWAALFSIVCGLFAASAAIRLAWQTARPLPDRAEAAQVFETMLPGKFLEHRILRSPAMFVIYEQPLGVDNFSSLLFGDGGEYQFGRTTASAEGAPADTRPDLATARDRLSANGWVVEETIVSDAVSCSTGACDPATLPKQYRVIAHREDTLLELQLVEQTDGWTYAHVELQRLTPWPAYPAGVAAGLLGALAGWLLFGWAARRTGQARPVVRVSANLLFGATLFLWGVWVPPSMLYSVQHHLGEPHPRWHPLWEWLGQPVASLPFLLGCGAGLLGLAIAALSPRQRELGKEAAA
jgi:hypothetical protein